jgi:predicted metalloprotease with PDZ domain
MAPFTDGGRTVDRTNWSNSVISYYPYGGAIALALDLSLRVRSDNRVSLDDFMRAMWRVHGKPGGARPGYVDHPYTLEDAEQRLAEVSGDAGFARDFFARFVRGRELPDYGRLLGAAGFDWRVQQPGRAWWGDLRVNPAGNSLKVVAAPLWNTPAYKAGLDLDDEIFEVDGTRVTTPSDLQSAIGRRKPGDAIAVVYADRSGRRRTVSVTLAENPAREIVPVESRGGTLTDAQRRFRRAWLGQ